MFYTAYAIIIIDPFISINTIYYYKGVNITKRTKIFKNYVNNFFIIDIVNILMLGLFDHNESGGAHNLMLLILFKIRSFEKVIKKVEENF
jgi:hypothetical protein